MRSALTVRKRSSCDNIACRQHQRLARLSERELDRTGDRFGAVFAIAIGSAVFATYGGLASPATVTAGFKPALWACTVFAGLAALAATAMSARPKPAAGVEPAGRPIAPQT